MSERQTFRHQFAEHHREIGQGQHHQANRNRIGHIFADVQPSFDDRAQVLFRSNSTNDAGQCQRKCEPDLDHGKRPFRCLSQSKKNACPAMPLTHQLAETRFVHHDKRHFCQDEESVEEQTHDNDACLFHLPCPFSGALFVLSACECIV